ncbi:hypothetical protein C8P68_105320 [Mucilaginibacter yixingensis]|uniref:Uncharacterized protein n=1 Tax=Mucilaginibacter yixingensis TaxID=1295612 RepID=A0A2T5J8N1_9SPHI|nr:hypothetical protein [Mucilaginibacter yixingensis]PTQ95810.1 hypothetical protein C8P68_105320 [Mucilaginibacter yixingensis]
MKYRYETSIVFNASPDDVRQTILYELKERGYEIAEEKVDLIRFKIPSAFFYPNWKTEPALPEGFFQFSTKGDKPVLILSFIASYNYPLFILAVSVLYCIVVDIFALFLAGFMLITLFIDRSIKRNNARELLAKCVGSNGQASV